MNISTKSLVSVIIPTYRGQRTLKRAIDSCLAQSYTETEVIVVDDNSPKSTARKETAAIMRYYTSNKRVTYMKHPENLNGAAARNTGFKCSRGAYISFLDDDDYYDNDKIKQQVKFLNEHSAIMAVTSTVIRNGRVVKMPTKDDYTSEILRSNAAPPTSSLMIRRSAYKKLGGFDEQYVRHQDYEFLLRYFQLYKIGFAKMAKVYMCTDGNDNRLSARELEDTKNMFLLDFSGLIQGLPQPRRSQRHIMSAKCCHLVFAYLKERDFSNSMRITIEGLQAARLYFILDCARYACGYLRQKALYA